MAFFFVPLAPLVVFLAGFLDAGFLSAIVLVWLLLLSAVPRCLRVSTPSARDAPDACTQARERTRPRAHDEAAKNEIPTAEAARTRAQTGATDRHDDEEREEERRKKVGPGRTSG